jgi:ABC-2 type transport system permease protein
MIEVLKSVYPGMIVMWVMFIAPTAFHDLYEERRRQTLHRLVVSSASLHEIILSKILRSFLLCFGCFWMLILVSSLIQGMQWGNWLALTGVMTCVTFAITGVICLLCGLGRSKEQLDALIPVFVLSTGCLGGSMMPYEQMPAIMQKVGVFTINYWGIKGFRLVLDTQPMSEILLPCLILAGVGLVTTSAGLYLLQKRFQQGVLV